MARVMHERSNASPVRSKTTLVSLNRERSNSSVTLRSSTNSSATTPLSDAATITSPRDVLPNAYLIKSLIAGTSSVRKARYRIMRDHARNASDLFDEGLATPSGLIRIFAQHVR